MSQSLNLKLLILLLLILLVGCDAFNVGNSDSNDANTTATEEAVEPAETPEVAVTQEVVDTANPLPNNNGSYYVAPAYATIEENLNVDQAPGTFYWVMATVTLANESGETVMVDPDDIQLIGDNGQRYPTYELVERVNPKLVGTELAAEDSVYGFALFALPPDVEPSLFEWCPGASCDQPLQAPISLQSN